MGKCRKGSLNKGNASSESSDRDGTVVGAEKDVGDDVVTGMMVAWSRFEYDSRYEQDSGDSWQLSSQARWVLMLSLEADVKRQTRAWATTCYIFSSVVVGRASRRMRHDGERVSPCILWCSEPSQRKNARTHTLRHKLEVCQCSC